MAKVENMTLDALNYGTVTFNEASGWIETEFPTRGQQLFEHKRNNLRKENDKLKKQVANLSQRVHIYNY